jgi:hypothetical protein
MTYDELIRSKKLKWGTYVFTDFDRLAYSDLELAGRIYGQLKEAGLRVLNNPATVKLRYALLRTLSRAGLNDFNVHKADEIPDNVRFPVYIREIRGHGQPCTGLLETRQQVDEALTAQTGLGMPLDHLALIEYAGEEIRPGVYRKLAGFRVGEIITPYLCGHDDQWLIKTGRIGVADEALYQDEFRIVQENPYADALRQAFELSSIEYGRADYGFYRGRLQIFEINTNPHIPAPAAHPSETRQHTIRLAWDKVIAAFHSIDSARGRDFVLPKDKALDRHRKWKRFLYRTRPVN